VGYVDVGHGVRLFAQDVGDGPAVVLVAGFGLDSQVWDRQVRQLASRHRVVCIDQRGHGRSDKTLDGYSIEQLGDDLVTALKRLDVGRCVLVGWSFGGQVAFRVAARNPGLVERLVLVGSNGVRASRSDGFPFGRTPEAMVKALVADERRDRLAARRSTVASGFATPPDPHLLDWLVGISLQMPSWSAVACYDAMLTADLLAELPSVRQPVLQIIGAADPVHSANGARWLAERLADARVVEIANCGHYPMFEAADGFDAALTGFLG
jgi:pimeloyl-ACP methyl ester carboxylesterase